MRAALWVGTMLEIWRKYVRNAGLDLMYRDEREFYDFMREQEAAGSWGELGCGEQGEQHSAALHESHFY